MSRRPVPWALPFTRVGSWIVARARPSAASIAAPAWSDTGPTACKNGARLGLRSEQERVRAALGSVRRVRALRPAPLRATNVGALSCGEFIPLTLYFCLW